MEHIVNPLLNPLVLKPIYKYLDFPNKKSFRLVCRTWLDSSLDLWRKQTKLVVNKNTDLALLLNLREVNGLDCFDFYKILEKPLLNLELNNVKISYKPTRLLQIKENIVENKFVRLQKLIVEEFGPFVECLEMTGVFFHSAQFGHGLKRILLKDFPNLKTLSISSPNIKLNMKREGVFEEFYEITQAENLTELNLDSPCLAIQDEEAKTIVNLVPNLKKLQLRGKACKIMEALKTSLTSGGHVLLESLGLNDNRVPFNLEKFTSWVTDYLDVAKPPLKSFKDSICPELISYGPVFTRLGDTLTCLDLRIWTNSSDRFFNLLSGFEFPKLTRLFLRIRDQNSVLFGLLNFDFGMLRGTPLLKVLHLDLEHKSTFLCAKIGQELEASELFRCNSLGPGFLKDLEDFRFEMLHKPTESGWRALAEIMPNVKKLHATFDEETFPFVFQLWPNLEQCLLSYYSTEFIRRQIIMGMQAEMKESCRIDLADYCREADWDKW